MKRLGILIALTLLLIVGGGLTAQLAARQGSIQLPVIRDTDNPDASALDMTPWKAEQLLLVIMFILFSPMPPGIIPLAIGIMALMWFLDWQVKSVRAKKGVLSQSTPATTEES